VCTLLSLAIELLLPLLLLLLLLIALQVLGAAGRQ
jgi:hypothetical protein